MQRSRSARRRSRCCCCWPHARSLHRTILIRAVTVGRPDRIIRYLLAPASWTTGGGCPDRDHPVTRQRMHRCTALASSFLPVSGLVPIPRILDVPDTSLNRARRLTKKDGAFPGYAAGSFDRSSVPGGKKRGHLHR